MVPLFKKVQVLFWTNVKVPTGGVSSANVETFEVPADGEGFCTVISMSPAAVATSDARMEAVNSVELTN